MSILDRKFPFVISHTKWRKRPEREVVRHYVGFVPGLIRLAININRGVLDMLEEAFYEEEVVTNDKGIGNTRNFAVDVGFVRTSEGQKPVLTCIETSVVPQCAHHYVVSSEEVVAPREDVDPVDVVLEHDDREHVRKRANLAEAAGAVHSAEDFFQDEESEQVPEEELAEEIAEVPEQEMESAERS